MRSSDPSISSSQPYCLIFYVRFPCFGDKENMGKKERKKERTKGKICGNVRKKKKI
jgi:hypothetical protein